MSTSNEFDLSAVVSTTGISPTQEPLIFEHMQRLVQELRDQYPEPPVEILSPTEYFRRTGFRLPLSEETLATPELPASFPFPFTREALYGFALQRHMNIADVCRAYRPSDIALMIEVEHAIGDLKKRLQEVKRLIALDRRQHRAKLRKRRQHRARQRRRRRGLA